MGRRLRGWQRLDWRERRLLGGLVVLIVPIHALLATAGYSRTKRILERLSRASARRSATPAELESALRLARLASMAGRHGLVEATCLRQSLLIHFLLRRDGLSPAIKIGVRRQGRAFDAHAWVELDGTSLDAAVVAHQPLLEYPARSRAP